jgi:hypothetical protein
MRTVFAFGSVPVGLIAVFSIAVIVGAFWGTGSTVQLWVDYLSLRLVALCVLFRSCVVSLIDANLWRTGVIIRLCIASVCWHLGIFLFDYYVVHFCIDGAVFWRHRINWHRGRLMCQWATALIDRL